MFDSVKPRVQIWDWQSPSTCKAVDLCKHGIGGHHVLLLRAVGTKGKYPGRYTVERSRRWVKNNNLEYIYMYVSYREKINFLSLKLCS